MALTLTRDRLIDIKNGHSGLEADKSESMEMAEALLRPLPSIPVDKMRELIDTINDVLTEARVDYPAGREAGARIEFDADDMAEMIRRTLEE